jgi:hypothetical protein
MNNRLRELRGRFFGELKRAGDAVGMALPEPHEVDLLEPGRSNLLEQLVALRTQAGHDEPDRRVALGRLRKKGDAVSRLWLARHPHRQMHATLAALRSPSDALHHDLLLRRRNLPADGALKALQA